MDRATVSTPTGRITVDFPRSTGIGVTRSETLLANVLHASVMLLVPMEEEAQAQLAEYLTVSSEVSAAPDEDDSEQLAFDELVEEKAGPAQTKPSTNT